MPSPSGEPRVAELAESLEFLTDVLGQLRTLDQTAPAALDGPLGELAELVRRRPHLAELPEAILRAHREITAALTGIRLTRQTIEAHALDRLRDTHCRLSEVSSTTESATLQILDGLDRALDRIDQLESSAHTDQGAVAIGHLRREVYQLFPHLQFQDITAQQLRGVSHFLQELEDRLGRVVLLLDHSLVGDPMGTGVLETETAVPPSAFDAAASLRDVAARQAEIDRTLSDAPRGGRATAA